MGKQNEIEKILDRKMINNEMFYLVKWKNSNQSENNTWVAETKLDCKKLITDYNKRFQMKNSNEFGYSRGLEIETILGATDAYGELLFLIKWKSLEKPELIPARIVNVESPQCVIRFYEDRLEWSQTDE